MTKEFFSLIGQPEVEPISLQKAGKITRAELQNITGLSESGVKKILRQLQQKGLLSRIGPDKGGHLGDNRAGRLRDNR